MGANIYPEDVETIIYKDELLPDRLHSFCLSVVTDSSATPRPCIGLELNGDRPHDGTWRERLAALFQAGLADLKLDYRAALGEFPAAMVPIVEVYARGEGTFKDEAWRNKPPRITERRGSPGSEYH